VSYNWDETKMLAKVTVEQTQNIDEDVFQFSVRTTLRFKGEGWVTDQEFQVSELKEDFYVTLEAKPTSIRFDPELTLFGEGHVQQAEG
tara:strand:+ start:1710 stop:1973 length:264 start_codon:yes stop_codon:yes gene_type:complete